jgi:hypothetical protein
MKLSLLPLCDFLTIALVTLIGFATHGEAVWALLPRMAVLFIPLTLAWFLLAPWFGLFSRETVSDPRRLWRAPLAMLFAASPALVVRGLLLNAPILPIFAVVLSAAAAVGILLWRSLAVLLVRRKT